jgi:hypothetical protein
LTHLKSKTLKPGYRVSGSRVESPNQALSGYGSQLDSQVVHNPTAVQDEDAVAAHDVAVQVAFERQTLKPIFHLIGYRLWV